MNEGIDLLQKVQKIIEDQEKEIKELRSQINQLKAALNGQKGGSANQKEPAQPPALGPGAGSNFIASQSQQHLKPHIEEKQDSSDSSSVLGSVLRRGKSPSRLSLEDCKAIASEVVSSSSEVSNKHTTTEDDEENMSVTSSDLSGTEDSTSIDSSSDVPVSFSPVPDSPRTPQSPDIIITTTLSSTPKVKVPTPGRRSAATLNKFGNSTNRDTFDWKQPEDNGETGEDDDFNRQSAATHFRKRVQTFGGHGGRQMLRVKQSLQPEESTDGGKSTKKAMDRSSKLERRNSFPGRGQHTVVYLSTDMEMKLQQIIQLALAEKYGGKEKANGAATVIQTAYRRYKNVQHFKLLRVRQQSTMQRRRTMSIKYPGGRRPSMIKRKPNSSLHDSSNIDKMTHVKTLYRNITQPKLSPNVSRRELLASNQLSPIATTASVHRNGLEEQPSPGKGATNMEASPLSMIDEGEDEHEEISELEQTYSEDRDQKPRSHSVFSGLSSSAIQKLFSSKHPVIVQQRESARSLNKKTTIGVNIFNRNPKRGIQYLVFEGVLDDSPYAVAHFLNSYYGISKEKIGEFVGEIRHDFNMAVLECLVESIDLSGKTIDIAIRDFQKLFRMPGEAQKIDKIMQMFASEYYKHNQDSGVLSEDAAYVLSFAIMMLHTDLHNPSVKRHMTKEEWVKMNRGTNDDEDFPKEFLLKIYDRIQQTEFETGKDHTHQVAEIRRKIVGHGIPPLANPQRRFIHQCDVYKVQDMNKRNMRRHKRTLFLFNDVVLITKQLGTDKYEFNKAFTLLNAQAVKFTTQYYKFGVCLQHEMNGEKYMCNCDSEGDRTRLHSKLTDAISELRDMEIERISDFAYKGKNGGQDKKSQTLKTEASTGDLISSIKMSSSAQNLRLGHDDMMVSNSHQSRSNHQSRSTMRDSSHKDRSPSPRMTVIPSSPSNGIDQSNQKDMAGKSKTLGNRAGKNASLLKSPAKNSEKRKSEPLAIDFVPSPNSSKSKKRTETK